MNSRERVLKAFKKMEGLPDCIPVEFDLCRQLLEKFSEELGIPICYTDNLWEDVTYRISGNEIRLALGNDVMVTGVGRSDDFEVKIQNDETWFNEYGMHMKQGSIYVEVVEYPLANAETIEDIDNYIFPDPYAKGRYRDVKTLVKKYKDDYLIIGNIEVTIFSLAQELVGMEKLMIDLAMKKKYTEYLFAACTELQTKIGLELIKRGVDAIWLGDDFGSQTSLLISRQMFIDKLKPYYKKMFKTFKESNPDIIIIFHTDGAIRPIVEDMIDMGVEVLNPIQPNVPGHSPQELKDEFGDKLVFFGGIDQQDLLPNGTDEELGKDIKEKIETLGKGGGYMISPAHILQADVSPERVKKFVELCLKYGKYKL